MPEESLPSLRIQVLPVDDSTDQEHLDDSCRQLYQEMLETDAEEVKLVSSGEPPAGAKGMEGLVAELAVSFVAHYAPVVVDQIRRWVKRSPERKLKLTSTISGKEIQMVISSQDLKTEDLNKLVNSLMASMEQ